MMGVILKRAILAYVGPSLAARAIIDLNEIPLEYR